MSSAYGNIASSTNAVSPFLDRVPVNYTTKSGLKLIIKRLRTHSDAEKTYALKTVQEILNYEIEKGNTYPQEFVLDDEGFRNYFLSSESFICYLKIDGLEKDNPLTKPSIVGAFYVKPNFPGRCSHICNGGFLVHQQFRQLSIGTVLGEHFLKIAPLLGYKASMFNLVFENNIGSVKIWQKLNMKVIGRIPRAGRLRKKRPVQNMEGSLNEEEYVDALMFYCDFLENAISRQSLKNAGMLVEEEETSVVD